MEKNSSDSISHSFGKLWKGKFALVLVSFLAGVILGAAPESASAIESREPAAQPSLPSQLESVRIFTLRENQAFETFSLRPENLKFECEFLLSADLRGEGHADILCVSKDGALQIGKIKERREIEFAEATFLPSRDDFVLLSGHFRCGTQESLLLISKKEKKLFLGSFGTTGELRFDSLPAQGSFPFSAAQFQVADENGDGLDDLLALTSTTAEWQESRGESGFSPLPLVTVDPTENFRQVIDADGDGRAELLVAHCDTTSGCSGINIRKSSGLIHPFPWAQFPYLAHPDEPRVGDFNGDGRMDALLYAGRIYRWWTASSLGPSALEQSVSGLFQEEKSRASEVVGDFDGDGLSDLFQKGAPNAPFLLSISRFADPLRIQLRLPPGSREDAPGHLLLSEKTDILTLLPPNFRGEVTSRRVYDGACRRNETRVIAISAEFEAEHVGAALRIGPDAKGPYVCLGYNPESPVKWGSVRGLCPDGYAIFAADEGNRRTGDPDHAYLGGKCCRLPASDILGEKIVEAKGECPDNFVAVGSLGSPEHYDEINPMLCREIRGERYQLGELREGKYRGLGFSMRAYTSSPSPDESIPLGVRFGVSRLSFGGLLVDSCHGDPLGTLLVKKAKRCWNQRYRELQYRGLPGDPVAGTPVTMFPQCRELENRYDPSAGCKP